MVRSWVASYALVGPEGCRDKVTKDGILNL